MKIYDLNVMGRLEELARSGRWFWTPSIDGGGNQCRSLAPVNSLTVLLGSASSKAPVFQTHEVPGVEMKAEG